MSASPQTGEPDLSLTDFWAQSRPGRHDAFRQLRARPAPTFFGAGESPFGVAERGYYALVRYADVAQASRSPEVFSSAAGATSIFDLPAKFTEYFGSLISMDDPRHARMRRIVSRGFTQNMINKLKQDIQRTAAAAVDDLLDTGPCDFVQQVSMPFPLKVICDMMGIGDEHYAMILRNTSIVLSGFDTEFVSGNESETGAQILAAGAELGELAAQLAEERMARPAGDLVSALVSADIDGERLTPAELASFFILLAVAGNDTTRNTLSHALILLTEHPDQRQLLLEDLGTRLGPAVEEIIRYATPVIWMRRTLTRDYTMNGTSYAEGDKVLLVYQSANRDEAVFADPDRFDITRSPNPHLGFGAPGPHFCLGARLARLETAVMLREILTRVPGIRAAGDPEYLLSNFSNGVKHLTCDLG